MDFPENFEIGDFRVERRLGAGGMGVVYLARQKSTELVYRKFYKTRAAAR